MQSYELSIKVLIMSFVMVHHFSLEALGNKHTSAVQELPTTQYSPFVWEAKKWLPDNPTIVECSARLGDHTNYMAHVWPLGFICALEASPSLYIRLKQAIGAFKNSACYQVLLSDENAYKKFYSSAWKNIVDFNHFSFNNVNCSPANYHEMLSFEHVMVPTRTLSQWMDEATISSIDFLWLNTQGFELSVLKASPEQVSHIKVIYTQTCFIEQYDGSGIYSKTEEWLTNQGFTPVMRDFELYSDKQSCGNTLFVKI